MFSKIGEEANGCLSVIKLIVILGILAALIGIFVICDEIASQFPG